MVHFIPLPKLPSTKETAEILLNQVFKLHVLPSDVVSDPAPQFISKFWKAFCYLLEMSVSLSSRDDPHYNGQTEMLNKEKGLQCLVSQTLALWS